MRRTPSRLARALDASGAQTYQKHGERVSIRRIAGVVAAVQGLEGLEQWLALLTLATAICNLDMHAKNIALLLPPDGSGRLALAYDMVPLIHYPGTDGRMAMAINVVYEHSRIRRDDLVAESVRWGMSDVRAVPGLQDLIESTVERLRSPD